MMQVKESCLFAKGYIYAFYIGLVIFCQTISYMVNAAMTPSLLPIKILAVYVVMLIVAIVVLIIMKQQDKRMNTIHKKDVIYLILGIIFIVCGFILSQRYYVKNFVETLANVNAMKRLGVLVNDSTAAIAYYIEGMTGIPAINVVNTCVPLVFLSVIIMFLYENAVCFGAASNKKGLVFIVESLMILFLDCDLSFCGTLLHDIGKIENQVFLIFPGLLFLMILKLCENYEKITISINDIAEFVVILGVGGVLDAKVIVVCIMEILIGVIYIFGRRYLKWVQSSKL